MNRISAEMAGEFGVATNEWGRSPRVRQSPIPSHHHRFGASSRCVGRTLIYKCDSHEEACKKVEWEILTGK